MAPTSSHQLLTALPRHLLLMARLALLCLLFLAGLSSGVANAEVQRYALVVGANHGLATEPPLRYAESDARRIGHILRDLGSFGRERTVVLTGANAEGVRAALDRLDRRIDRENPGDALLFVFYSGHADAGALHLQGTSLPMEEVRERVVRSRATARVLVIDACRSGAVTRVKGGRPGPSFRIDLDDDLRARGLAILTSSAAGEDAQESDQLEASFFTHYLASALRGAADANGDGGVGLNEAFSWAAERTLVATSSTLAGPQHPTYQVDLGGRRDLILTRPDTRSGKLGALSFSEQGNYLVQRATRGGAVVGEVTVALAGAAARRLVVPAGRYAITLRRDDSLSRGEFAVSRGDVTQVANADMTPVRAVRVATKGGDGVDERLVSLSAFATGGARGSILGLGVAPRVEVGIALDYDWLSLELRGIYSNSVRTNDSVRILNHEAGVAAAVLANFDLDLIELAAGAELGVLWLGQRVSGNVSESRNASATSVGLFARARIPLWEWLYARLDGGLLVYFLQRGVGPVDARIDTPPTFRFAAGLGARF